MAPKRHRKGSRLPPTRQLVGLPERLKDAMEQSGMTVTSLGVDSGVGPPRVSRAVNGDRLEGIAADTVIRMAGSLGVRVGWLLAGEAPRQAGAVAVIDPSFQELREELREDIRIVVAEQMGRVLPTDKVDEPHRRVRKPARAGKNGK